MSTTVRPVILSGGSGTRLWPLSTPERPKQFLELVGEPLLVQAMGRLHGIAGLADAVVVTGGDQVALVTDAAERADVALHRIVVEPVGRNTAPALIAASLTLAPDEVMVVLPADHLIVDRESFLAAADRAVTHAGEGAVVAFGIQPSRPETGYGYIEVGPEIDGGFEIAGFIEKPGPAEAEEMLSKGGFLWNSGMFVFRVDILLEEARRLVPDMVTTIASSLSEVTEGITYLSDGFGSVDAVSVDTAIMERTSIGRVVPLDAGWTDVGSWQALWEVSEHDADENAIVGEVTAVDVRGSYLYSSGRKIAVAGVDDIVVVETPEQVLVVGLDASQKVRDLLADGQSHR